MIDFSGLSGFSCSPFLFLTVDVCFLFTSSHAAGYPAKSYTEIEGADELDRFWVLVTTICCILQRIVLIVYGN